eukprot:4277805-Alexandrium_andersonii.AAC.1
MEDAQGQQARKHTSATSRKRECKSTCRQAASCTCSCCSMDTQSRMHRCPEWRVVRECEG